MAKPSKAIQYRIVLNRPVTVENGTIFLHPGMNAVIVRADILSQIPREAIVHADPV